MGTQDLADHLPAALRFARGLTRSSREGEALVETTLNALLAGDAAFDPSLPLPAALLECVHRSWIPVDAPGAARPGEADAMLDALSRVPPSGRGALLLIRFEGLSPADAARVLGLSEAEALRRLAQAERRLLRQPNPRVLIVEEHAEAAAELQDLVVELDCEVVGPAPPAEAADLAASQRPDLILAAVSGRSELDVVKAIRRRRGTPAIIVTDTPPPAHDGGDPLDWIAASPFDPEAAALRINQALGRHPDHPSAGA